MLSGRVVALRPLGLGDLCTAVPALRAIRRAWPAAELTLAAAAWQAPLARLAGVDRVVAIGARGPLDEALWGADLAVNLHGRGPSSTRRALSLRPRRLIAFHHPDLEATAGAPRWSADEHEIARWCRLLAESGIAADPHDLHLDPDDLPPPAVRGAVVVHPGAAAAGRRWPARRFGTVAAALARAGERVLIVGSAAEAPVCREVAAAAMSVGCPPAALADLGGRTSLVDLASLVGAARLLVANDSGVAHLATATRTASVVLFGPTDPARWGPPASSLHRAIWKGRTGDPHAAGLDRGLAQIGVAEVLTAARSVLDVYAPTRPGTGR